MDRFKAIVNSQDTVSDKIRALDAAGIPRAEIARLLGKRYQHVRNVLEGDKVGQAAASAAVSRGVEEAAQSFGDVHRLPIAADGSVRFPPEVLAVIGGRPGGVMIAELEADRLIILSPEASMRKIQAMLAPFADPSRLASEELIAERREEARREEME
jgi:hypothetical protein